MVVVILAVACLCSAQDECGPTETPWGVACQMTADDCRPFLRPLFVDGAIETTNVRLVVDYDSGEPDVRESEVSWVGVEGPMRFRADDIPGNPARIRWYSKHVADPVYHDLPAYDCWCEPTTGEIERCVVGELQPKEAP